MTQPDRTVSNSALHEKQEKQKAIGGEVINLSFFEQQGLSPLLDESKATLESAMMEHGFLVVNQEGKIVGYVKPPQHRDQEGQLKSSDYVKIPYVYNQGINPLQLGMEMETFFVDNDGKFTDVSGIQKNKKILKKGKEKLQYAWEFVTNTLETNLDPATKPEDRMQSVITTLVDLVHDTAPSGKSMYPFSNYERSFQPGEETDHPYIRKMIKHLGWENLQDFTGAGIHMHEEWLDPEVALDTINRAEIVLAPLIHILSADSPIAQNSTQPELQKSFLHKKDFLKESAFGALPHEGKWHTTRYITRLVGSRNAGVLPEPLPDSLEDYWKIAKQVLYDNKTVSVARLFQDHGNFRYRPELKTIEICIADKASFNIARIMAMQEFVRFGLFNIQAVIKNRKLTEYAEKYPLLFQNGKVTADMLEKAQISNIEIAKHGSDAHIYAANGSLTSAREVLSQMLDFLSEEMTADTEVFVDVPEASTQKIKQTIHHAGYGITDGIKHEIMRSFEKPQQKDFETHMVEKIVGGVKVDVVDPRGYYEIGSRGTASDWIIATIESLEKAGLPDREVIRETTKLWSEAVSAHIMSAHHAKETLYNSLYEQPLRRPIA